MAFCLGFAPKYLLPRIVLFPSPKLQSLGVDVSSPFCSHNPFPFISTHHPLLYLPVHLSLSMRIPVCYIIPAATNKHSTQILVSKYQSPARRTRASWRNGCFQHRGKNKVTRNIFLCKEVRKCSENNGDISEEHRIQVERTFTGQIWDNISK